MHNDKDQFRASSGRTDLGVLGLKKAKVQLYKDRSIPVKTIAKQLDISKTTLYLYLRHRNGCIGEKI